MKTVNSFCGGSALVGCSLSGSEPGKRGSPVARISANRSAKAQKREAIAARDKLEAKNRELRSLLEEAAQSDWLVAKEKLIAGEAPAALAHLARAISYEPISTLAPETAVAALNDWRFPLPLATLRGHQGALFGAQFSPNGERIVTASSDNTARFWDTDTGKLLATLHGHEGPVYSAQFTPDGKRILTASSDKTARLWDTDSGKLLAALQGHEGFVYRAQFSPDGKRIVTASFDNTARLWETDSGKLLATLQGHERSVNSAQFSPDGKRIVTASDDETARLWTVLPPGAGAPPEWFRDFLHYLAHQRLNQDGELKWIPSTELATIHDRLAMAADGSSAEGETPYLRVLRHFVHE